MNNKYIGVTFQMTAFEATALDALSYKLGLAPGEIVRTAIRVYFAQHFPERVTAPSVELAEKVALLQP